MPTNHFHQHRLEALRAALEDQGLAGVILSRPQHVFYFTGVMPDSSPTFLIILPKRMLAVATVPLPEIETMTYTAYDIQNGWKVTDNAAGVLRKTLKGCRISGKNIGLEMEHLPSVYMPAIMSSAGELDDVEDILWNLRRVKDAHEITQIESNVAGNDRVFKRVHEVLHPGMSEIDLWGVVYHAMVENAGEPISLEADLGAGSRSSDPSVKPSSAKIAVGDAVMVDIYSATHGYYADTTRVFSLGETTEKHHSIHDVLVSALRAGEERLRPGVPANQVDTAVRGVIQKAGYGANFPHHSGHAFGLFQQERPYIIPAESMPLMAGMILTLEPGIYLPGWGGMRLEGNYLIESKGARRLDHFPSEITICSDH